MQTIGQFLQSAFGTFGAHWVYFALLLVYLLSIAGALGRSMGVHNLFLDDPHVLDEPNLWRRLRNSRVFWSQCGAMVLIGTVAITIWMALNCADLAPTAPQRFASCFPDYGILGLLSTTLLPIILLGFFASLALASRGARKLQLEWDELAKANRKIPRKTRENFAMLAGSGALFGLVVLLLMALLANLIASAINPQWHIGYVGHYLSFVFVILVIWSASMFFSYHAAFAVALVFALTVGAGKLYLLFAHAVFGPNAPVSFIALIGLVGVIIFTNGGKNKLTIPGFNYQRTVDPVARQQPTSAADRLDPVAALKAWKANTETEKPVIAFLATSGGAYRASFWTSLILDRLGEDKIAKKLLPNIRLITGASGGMVAGAYFTAMRAKGNHGNVTAQIEDDIAAAQASDPNNPRDDNAKHIVQERDSITQIVATFLRHDLLRIFLPLPQKDDRGRRLDRQWKTLNTTFKDLKQSESQGIAPSIIVSPTLVESGAPAFFTNLDLSQIRKDGAADPDATSVEIFEYFPEAHANVSLATATRLNATFPYVSPAISLPTPATHSRRVVDAGYYDNYGITTLNAYLSNEKIAAWIKENCAGAVILEVQAFAADREEPMPTTGFWARMGRAFHFISSPLAGFLAARSSAQKFRNDLMIRDTVRDFNAGTEIGSAFMRRFVFTNKAKNISLNWYLPEHEMFAQKSQLTENEAQFAGLADFLENLAVKP